MTRTSIGGDDPVRLDAAMDRQHVVFMTSVSPMLGSTVAEAPRRFVPKTALAKKLYAIRQREIAAGRLVPRDAQEILDELEAERARG